MTEVGAWSECCEVRLAECSEARLARCEGMFPVTHEVLLQLHVTHDEQRARLTNCFVMVFSSREGYRERPLGRPSQGAVGQTLKIQCPSIFSLVSSS